MLVIKYKSRDLEKTCTIACEAIKKYGQEMADLIQLRIDQISAVDTVEELQQYKIGRCHKLIGDRKNQYAMDLKHPYRLVFEKREERVQIVLIIEITDYH